LRKNYLGVSNKNQKSEKTGKKITKKTEPLKNPIRIFKKPTGSIRFKFYKPETDKTEPNPNKKTRAKQEPVGLNKFLFLNN
jgi:hypothetical protein